MRRVGCAVACVLLAYPASFHEAPIYPEQPIVMRRTGGFVDEPFTTVAAWPR
ncbi:Hypothetical protein XFF4834R_chr35790 [Xanthomonas citri pv. fuscans]|nr:Hypothetical protein XFF4834R_chr35790 [Xanthomonas citri pv. fuscans]